MNTGANFDQSAISACFVDSIYNFSLCPSCGVSKHISVARLYLSGDAVCDKVRRGERDQRNQVSCHVDLCTPFVQLNSWSGVRIVLLPEDG